MHENTGWGFFMNCGGVRIRMIPLEIDRASSRSRIGLAGSIETLPRTLSLARIPGTMDKAQLRAIARKIRGPESEGCLRTAFMRGEYSKGVCVGTPHKIEKKRYLLTPLPGGSRLGGGGW